MSTDRTLSGAKVSLIARWLDRWIDRCEVCGKPFWPGRKRVEIHSDPLVARQHWAAFGCWNGCVRHAGCAR